MKDHEDCWRRSWGLLEKGDGVSSSMVERCLWLMKESGEDTTGCIVGGRISGRTRVYHKKAGPG